MDKKDLYIKYSNILTKGKTYTDTEGNTYEILGIDEDLLVSYIFKNKNDGDMIMSDSLSHIKKLLDIDYIEPHD